ncbi:MAG: fasciclin domain-containing protein [Burkholderiaceae bacterium]|nr:fasciclin domain-containing protein [Burkholderiaceae bacterium]
MKIKRRTLLLTAVAGAASTLLAGCGGGDDDLGDIVAVAQATPDFSILVEAVAAAGLVNTLKGTGPFTVFAPTNTAFAAALTELGLTKEQLLTSPLLGDILKYHVVSGRVLKADVPVGVDIPTVLGATETFQISSALAITDEAGRVANITATDVLTSNGVIHVIDKVILPSAFLPA